MAKLGPEIITEEINIDEDESSTDTEATSGSCGSVQCQQQIKGEHFADPTPAARQKLSEEQPCWFGPETGLVPSHASGSGQNQRFSSNDYKHGGLVVCSINGGGYIACRGH